jgi:hypothetical protein
MSEKPVDPPLKTIRRRTKELAAAVTADPDAQALLLFYAAECGLKTLYMSNYSLRTTSDETASMPSARSYGHKLDQLITVLRVSPQDIPAHPAPLNLRSGPSIRVQHLHEAWRYGEKVQQHDDAISWLNKIISYVSVRL